jgi:DNA-binding transcriptional MerR regulator
MQSINAESEELLTIDQVSMIVDIPVSTIRKYCSRYRKYLHLKRGDNNALMFTKESIQLLVKARELTRQGLRLNTIVGLISGQSKSNLTTFMDMDPIPPSEKNSSGYPGGNELDQVVKGNHDQVTVTQLVKGLIESHLSQIEDSFNARFEELQTENESLKLEVKKREVFYAEQTRELKDELLVLNENREADKMTNSQVLKKVWETEDSIKKIQESQGFFATLKRWIGLDV